MDRYINEDSEDKISREMKNTDLYQNIGQNSRYTNFKDITNAKSYELSEEEKTNKTRENYQKMRAYSNLIPGPKIKRELDEFKNIYCQKENRIYDINSVIAEARKNHLENDEKESKRKLKNDKYNILLSMTKEELEEYRKSRKEKYTHPDEDEIRELIDTIASKTLAGEIDKATSVNLLSELMATSMMDRVDGQLENISNHTDEKKDTAIETTNEAEVNDNDDGDEVESDETNEGDVSDDEKDSTISVEAQKISIDEIKILNEEVKKKDKLTDTKFYTKSMNITAADFEDEMDDEFKEKSLPFLLKALIFLIIIIILAVSAFFLYKMFK